MFLSLWEAPYGGSASCLWSQGVGGVQVWLAQIYVPLTADDYYFEVTVDSTTVRPGGNPRGPVSGRSLGVQEVETNSARDDCGAADGDGCRLLPFLPPLALQI